MVKKGNHALGVVGAFLGLIVGLIPNILVYHFANYLIGVLFALVPICIAFGYYLLGRTGGGGAIALTVVLSLVGAVIFSFTVEYLGFYEVLTDGDSSITWEQKDAFLAFVDEGLESGEITVEDIEKEFDISFLPKDSSIGAFVPFYIEAIKVNSNNILLSIGQILLFMVLGLVIGGRFAFGMLLSGKAHKAAPVDPNATYIPATPVEYTNAQSTAIPQPVSTEAAQTVETNDVVAAEAAPEVAPEAVVAPANDEN